MNKWYSVLFLWAFFAIFCGNAFAFTLNGTVKDVNGNAVQGASVFLLKNGISTLTDENGSFLIYEDINSASVTPSQALDYFAFNKGILNFSQNKGVPTQVKVFDMMGNQIFITALQGLGSINFNKVIDAQGNYIACIKMGNIQKNFRFNIQKNSAKPLAYKSSRQSLKLIAETNETLQVSAPGFDTLRVTLTNLDTTLNLILSKTASTEIEYDFGYALKNAPRPSRGCGKDPSIREVSTHYNGTSKLYKINSAGLEREFFMDLPKNYDNKKPYKILIANHCMGSNAEDFAVKSGDQDHPTPYYGQKVLDTENNYIFVAPHGDTDGMPWRILDDKDHIFFDEMLTLLEDNFCIDTSRVFVTGFSFGSMYSNSLAQVFQHRIRAVVTYAVADWNIYIPENAGKPIAWMNVHGVQDNRCTYANMNSSITRILKNNGPNGTDVSDEINQMERYSGGNNHVCYNFKKVDPRFPVQVCTWGGGHQWTAFDYGDWHNTWVPQKVREFLEQF